MKIKRITNITSLPRGKELVLYNAPYFAIVKENGQSDEEHAIACSVYEYKQKYGREPSIVYIHKSNLFIPV